MAKSQQRKVGNRAKGRRAVHLKGYYEARYLVTAHNKRVRAERRARKKARWRAIGIKKNGTPVR